jgi:beta-mannosidase
MSQRINLNDGWQIWHYPPGAGESQVISAPDFEPQGWIPAIVPGDVHLDMTHAGLIADPMIDCNAEQCYWMEKEEWWYRSTFEVPAGATWQQAELYFGGLDTTAAIWLNGAPVGEHDNFFSQYTCDVSSVLRPGQNVLVVRLNCGLLAAEGKPFEKYYDAMRHHLTEFLPRPWIRKPAYTFRWDWSQRLLTCGIWQDVELRLHAGLAVRDVFLHSRVETDRAVVTADVEVDSYAAAPQQAYLTARLDGDRTYEAQLAVTVAPGPNRVSVRIPVDKPRLWWPNGSGESYLYDFTLTVCDDEGARDAFACRHGIREVELLQEPQPDGTQSFVFAINGQHIFGRGANWAPADCFPGSMNRERYYALVAEAANANFNLFRINGVGLYEKDSFFQVCDELGVMLWQDFTYSCGHYPDDDPEFVAEAAREATAVVRRLRNHPSLIMWCGNNENQQLHFSAKQHGDVDHFYGEKIYHQVIPEVLSSMDSTRPYWPGSAYGGLDPQDARLGDRHAWDVSLGKEGESFRAYNKDTAKFVSEFGFLAPPVRGTLERFLSPDQIHPGSEAWKYRDNIFERGFMTTGLARYYGMDAAQTPLDEYILYNQIVQAEALKYGIEHYRRRKYGCGGALFWSYNDCWGVTTGWTIIDYYLARKASYYTVRRAFNPVLVSFREEPGGRLSLWLTNDKLATVEGELVYGLKTLQGQDIIAAQRAVTLPADSSFEVAECRLPDNAAAEGCVWWAQLTADGVVLSENRFFPIPLEGLALDAPPIEQRLEPLGGGKYRLIFKAPAYAWMVRLSPPSEVRVDDDFFDLLPGQEKAVTVEGPAAAVAALKAVATPKQAA